MNYVMKCTCGHEVFCSAESQEEAVGKFQAMMNQAAFDAHFAARHAGEQKPNLADAHAGMGQTVQTQMASRGITLPAVKLPA